MKINLPVIVLKGIVLLPHNEIRIDLDGDNKHVIDSSELFHDRKILIVSDTDTLEETKKINDLPKYGVIAKISQKIELPNHKTRIILSGLNRGTVIEYLYPKEKEGMLECIVEILMTKKIDNEEILTNKLKKEIEKYTKLPYVSNSVVSIIQSLTNLDKITDIIVPYLQITLDKYESYLYENDSIKRMEMILNDIYQEQESFEIEKNIDLKVKKQLDDSQKDYILREKLKIIKEELKETSLKENDLNELKEKLDKLNASNKIKTRIELEIRRYESLPPSSPEISVSRNYIEWLLDLPWDNHTIDNDNLLEVREKLDESHNGLESVKTRIIEYLAVKQLTNSLRGPIICLVGPPGVGKTSLASGVATAINRKFVKMSVGGMNDEAEIIGHRKTYIGAAPGRIIASIKKAGSSNPVFLIDEIDKMTKNFKGDPASVLLEILDPEQNKYFSDHYIEEEYDLSKVIFIATANNLEDIPEALRDRLEIVRLSGYTDLEKLDIAKNYLIPRVCKEHGINNKAVIIKDEVILNVIRKYTKEAGVRELNRVISSIIRKIVTSLATKKITMNKFYVDDKKILEFLGKEKYLTSKKTKFDIGTVNGLAYTQYGGMVLPIEVTTFDGNGKMTLTGLLGDVMKESAIVALNYIKSNYKYFHIELSKLNQDIHIHIPEGAINKDGPSAGIALTTAIISVLTNQKISNEIAMTGEITLRGNVLPIGGLKEKCIGAYTNGIKKIILPIANKNDMDEIPDEVKQNVEFIFVKDYKEIYKIVKEKTKNE